MKASLLVIVVLLCLGLPIVKAEGDGAVSWISPTTRSLWDVFMVSADDGWAVGRQGVIVRWNGTDWNSVTSPSIHSGEPRLTSVFMVSADDGWAVGECAVSDATRDEHENIIHWNGTCWNRVASPTVCILRSVFMVSADDGWAVGKSWIIEEGWACGGPGVIIHWNGTSWNNVTYPTTSWLNSVFMVSADDGWAVGEDGVFFDANHSALPGPERVGRIIHWDGDSWNNVTSPTKSYLWSVFMVSADDGWAVGSGGTIIRWNGTSWNNVTSPVTYELMSVFMLDADDGWAVGFKKDGPGKIIRWDGTSWNSVTRSPETYALYSVFMVGPDDGWAVGEGGTIQRWTGTEWIPEFPSATLAPVFICLTLVAVILAKAAPKKYRRSASPSKPQL